jgi:hypothetical protein
MSPVKYELGFYIPADDILHSHRRETLKSYTTLVLLVRVKVAETKRLGLSAQNGGPIELSLGYIVASSLDVCSLAIEPCSDP